MTDEQPEMVEEPLPVLDPDEAADEAAHLATGHEGQPDEEQVLVDDGDPALDQPPVRRRFVRYLYPLGGNERVLTVQDWAKVGLPDHEETRWDQSNGWQIPLEDLEVPEELVASIFTPSNDFEVIG